ncbi:hypothetical protein BGZ94_005453 [Podila epigama]|nr:hypothetical protein BGZ94_005453 [Podila epigama]
MVQKISLITIAAVLALMASTTSPLVDAAPIHDIHLSRRGLIPDLKDPVGQASGLASGLGKARRSLGDAIQNAITEIGATTVKHTAPGEASKKAGEILQQ